MSQPAISSQVKRLQGMIGGSLFVKTANGTTTTELGKLALAIMPDEFSKRTTRCYGSAATPPVRSY